MKLNNSCIEDSVFHGCEKINELCESFNKDGVVCIRDALNSNEMELAEQAFLWSLNHPGPGARNVLAGKRGSFYQDHANPDSFPVYQNLLFNSGLTELICNILGSKNLWLLYEQIWFKDHGETLRTPWHQDLPYVPMSGDHLVTAWINLDPVPEHLSLEFVPGSHRGPLFNPTAFDAKEPSAAMFAAGTWPELPNIESERDKWQIISWEISPGDVILFHPAVLHGGAPTYANGRRRTISLRFFGDMAYCAKRPENGLAEIDRLMKDDSQSDPMLEMAHQPEGALFRHPGFPQLR